MPALVLGASDRAFSAGVRWRGRRGAVGIEGNAGLAAPRAIAVCLGAGGAGAAGGRLAGGGGRGRGGRERSGGSGGRGPVAGRGAPAGGPRGPKGRGCDRGGPVCGPMAAANSPPAPETAASAPNRPPKRRRIRVGLSADSRRRQT